MQRESIRRGGTTKRERETEGTTYARCNHPLELHNGRRGKNGEAKISSNYRSFITNQEGGKKRDCVPMKRRGKLARWESAERASSLQPREGRGIICTRPYEHALVQWYCHRNYISVARALLLFHSSSSGAAKKRDTRRQQPNNFAAKLTYLKRDGGSLIRG